MSRTNAIWDVLGGKHSLANLRSHNSLPIRFADARNLPNTIGGAHVVVWLSLGNDCVQESGVDVESVKKALHSVDYSMRPRLLVICMKYGAERAAKTLSSELPVIWLSGDLVSSNDGAQQVAAIVDTVRRLLNRKSGMSLLADAVREMVGRKGIHDAGSWGDLSSHEAYNRVIDGSAPDIARDFDADRFEGITCSFEELLSQDIAHVNSISQELLNDKGRVKTWLHLVTQGASCSAKHERRRSVAIHVLETLSESEFQRILRIGTLDETTLLKNQQLPTLIWLDLDDPLDASHMKILKKWRKNFPFLVILLTMESDGNAELPLPGFNLQDVCDGDGKCSFVSDLHDDIPISWHSKSEGKLALLNYFSRTELNGLILRAIHLIDRRAFLAGIFEGNNEGELVLRVSVCDIGFLQTLRDCMVLGTFATMLTQAAQELAAPAGRNLKRVDTATLAEALAVSDTSVSASTPASPHVKPSQLPNDLTVEIDLTAFANMYESSILRLDKLTPHQEIKLGEALRLVDNRQNLHVKAPAGAGKTFVAMQLILHKLREGPVLYVAVCSTTHPALAPPLLDCCRMCVVHMCTARSCPLLLFGQLGCAALG